MKDDKRHGSIKWVRAWICFAAVTMLAVNAVAEDKPAGPPPVKVVVAQVQEKMVAENTPIIGTLSYDKVSNLSPEVSGQVKEVRFEEGDRLKKGAVMVRLNTDFIDRDIEIAEIRISQLNVQLERVEKDLNRYRTLFDQQAASEKDFDDLEFARREMIHQRDVLKRQMEVERLRKEKSEIRAPFDGIVLQKHVEVGDWVAPGIQICSIGSLNHLIVRVPVAEEILAYARKGSATDVMLHSLDRNITGKVIGVVPIADPKTKNVMLKIQLPQLDSVVENMSATVRVPVSAEKRLKLIPRDALVKFQGKDFVYTVKDGKSVIIPVTIVSFTGEFAGVDTPLVEDGMEVVVDGNQRLQPNQPVVVVPAERTKKS